MALSRVTTWVSAQVLTASALNGEFDNILNNGSDLIFPLTEAADFNGQVLQNLAAGSVSSPGLYFNSDANTGIYRSAADVVDVAVGGNRGLSISTVTIASSYLAVGHGSVTTPQRITTTATGTASNISWVLATTGTGYLVVPTGASADANVIPGVAMSGDEGTGLARLATGTLSLVANSREVLRASPYASATNYLQVAPSSTGSPVVVGVAGGDTNIDLRLEAKGSGLVRAATGFASVAFGGANPAPAHALFRDNTMKAWVVFDDTPTIQSSFGVSGVAKNATGEYTVTWSNAFNATPYMVFAIVQPTNGTQDQFIALQPSVAQTTTTSRFKVFNSSAGAATPNLVWVAAMGA